MTLGDEWETKTCVEQVPLERTILRISNYHSVLFDSQEIKSLRTKRFWQYGEGFGEHKVNIGRRKYEDFLEKSDSWQ